MLSIPTRESARDISMETCLALGANWAVGQVPVGSLCAGHVALWDILSLPFAGVESDITLRATQEAVTVILEGHKCVDAVLAMLTGSPNRWQEMLTDSVNGDNWQLVARQLRAVTEHAFAGYETMVTGGNKSDGTLSRFDSMWLAGYIHAVTTAAPAVSVGEALWSLPLAIGSHLNAAACAHARPDIELRRPLDISAAMRAMTEGA
jgi:hypothetical protein